MRLPITILSLSLSTIFLGNSYTDRKLNSTYSGFDDMMMRIAEIEIDTNFIENYMRILSNEAEASVRLEPGVICIFPMFQKENPTEIRILEIYANKDAYESHLLTPHFKHYKATTLNMVKSLKLVDVEAIDEAIMSKIFKNLEPDKK